MKKILAVIVSVFTAALEAYSQKDSLRRNEVFVNTLPALTVASGGEPTSISNWSAGYRRLSKNNWVYGVSLHLFLRDNRFANVPLYDSTVASGNIFLISSSGGSHKTQLNIEAERIYRKNRLTHGAGINLGVHRQVFVFTNQYYLHRFNVKNPAHFDSTWTIIDSLSTELRGTRSGVAAQFFYSVRYAISPRWVLRAVLGPSLSFSRFRGRHSGGNFNAQQTYSQFDFPNVPLLSEFSLSFRF